MKTEVVLLVSSIYLKTFSMTLRKKKKNTCCLSHLVPSTICDAYPYGVLQDATSLLSESLSSSFERAPLQKVSLGSRRYMRI